MATGFQSMLVRKALDLSAVHGKMGIVEFVESPQGLNAKRFPSQKFLLKLFAKEPLRDEVKDIEIRDQFNERVIGSFTERGFYEYLWEDGRISMPYSDYLVTPITQIQLNMGRRASKSTTIVDFVAYTLYEILLLDFPQEYFGVLPSGKMNITMTALGAENANKLFGKFVGVLSTAPFFKRFMLEEPNTSSMKLWTLRDIEKLGGRTPHQHSNSINVYASANTPGVRGDDNIAVLMDEFAHYNVSAKSTREEPLDESIFNALSPSISGFKKPDGTPFGKMLILSSPKGKKGKFYRDYVQAFELGAKSHTLAISAPTWEINKIVSPIYLRAQYNKAPAVYLQEYGAKFQDGGTSWLSDLAAYYKCFDVRLNARASHGRIDRVYFLGLDFALSNDGTSATVSHWEPEYPMSLEDFPRELFQFESKESVEEFLRVSKGKFVVDYSEVRYAGQPPYEDRAVLSIEEVLDWVEWILAHFPIQYGIYDQWSGVIIEQMIKARGIKCLEMITHSAMTNDSQYKLFSTLLHEGRLVMPNDDSLHRELLNLRCESRANGILSVEAEHGGHDDRFDSLIRSLYLAWSYHNKSNVIAGQNMNGLFTRKSLIASQNSFSSLEGKAYKHFQEAQHLSGSGNIRTPKYMAQSRTGLSRLRGR